MKIVVRTNGPISDTAKAQIMKVIQREHPKATTVTNTGNMVQKRR